MKARTHPERIYTASSRRIMLVLSSLGTMYEYMYCSMLASAMSLAPVYGGALSLSSRMCVTFLRYAFGEGRKYLAKRTRAAFMALLALMLLCLLILLAVYPELITENAAWVTLSVVIAQTFSRMLGRRLVGHRMRRTIAKRAFLLLMSALLLIPTGIVSALLFWVMPSNSAIHMLLGYALGLLTLCYGFWRERDLIAVEGAPDDISAETVERIAGELRQVNAYDAYKRMHMIVLVALQLTMTLVYTFIGLSIAELLNCMIIMAFCALIVLEAASFCLRRMNKTFAVQLLLFGIFLWMFGLFRFYRALGIAPGSPFGYISLALSVSGLSISVTSLADLERRMTDVASFKLRDHMRGYSQLRAASTEIAILFGQMLALILLLILCLSAGKSHTTNISDLIGAFRPILIVPPIAMVLAALVSVMHFPMNNRHFQKLAKWLTFTDGEDNPALKKQLDSVVIKRRKNRFGVKLMMAIVRPLFFHRVLGRENLDPYEDGDIILICNHGEIYGPIVANLYIPISFRPWVLDNMMDKEAIVEHIYRGTMLRQKWLPESWKLPLVRLFAPLLGWVFNSLDAIPVYRGKPHELIGTFRQTVEAMQAGDNILLFPENGEVSVVGAKGYVNDGVGKLYTGFAMIAQLYWAKTKRRAVFMPIFASRIRRTLTIGEGVVYNPEAPANEEKQRIADELLARMRAICEGERGKQ